MHTCRGWLAVSPHLEIRLQVYNTEAKVRTVM